MGDVNFGGVPDNDADQPPPVELMQLLHGAYYGVPPAGADFPGSDLFAAGASAPLRIASSPPGASRRRRAG